MTEKKLRELVDRSKLVLAHYWPMSTFVHHNPIRDLETLPFAEAVRIGRRFIGGRGYLPNETYRDLVRTGRIASHHVDAAVRSLARDEEIEVAGRWISHFDVLRTHLLEGITAPSAETIHAAIDHAPGSARKRALAELLTPTVEPPDDVGPIGRDMTLVSWCDKVFHTQLSWLIDRELIKWCEAFLDEGHAVWSMPHREEGFFEAWRVLAAREWFPCGIENIGQKIAALPKSPEKAVITLLSALAIPDELAQDYIALELSALNGWASFINWRAHQSSYEWQAAHPIDLIQYLAVRLVYERELVAQICRAELGIEGNLDAIVSHLRRRNALSKSDGIETARLTSAWRLDRLAEALGISPRDLSTAVPEKLQQLVDWLDEFPESEHGPVWLEAHEAGYQEDLIARLRAAVPESAVDANAERPLAQAAFCIDVRSEPFRRNLEAAGNYETLGFAGFFGIPTRFQALDHHHETDQLPAILQARYRIREVVRADQKEQLARRRAGVGLLHTLHETLHDLKSHVLTPFIAVESLGWIFSVPLIGRTVFPRTYRKWREQIRKTIAPPVGTQMTVDKDLAGLGLTLEEQAATVETVLKMMGLTRKFARLVVVCGHTSTSDNNPYEAALNCGACGGNSGEPNSRLFAALANKPHVRAHLAQKGIVVPEDTHFIGGVHNTTTDVVDLFDLQVLPHTHDKDVEQLKADLRKAALGTNHERCVRLPGAKSLSPEEAADEIGRRAGDWSETRPEWGLSGNASFIIGRRTLTSALNLQGRAFLNSYDYRIDPTGALLEGIMNGPMVVGQWINAEHYFSATDPEVYGSGSKIYHNVVGRIGIMSGPQSDLRTGLAWQSMMIGEITYHEPVRLLVAIEAPRERILEIVQRQPILKQLCDNEWIHLVAIDRDSDEMLYRYRPNQAWVSIPAECSPGTRIEVPS